MAGSYDEGSQRSPKKALVIAISDYKSSLPKLDFCKRDGEQMTSILRSLDYEVPESNCLVGQVTFNQMRRAIIDFFGSSNIGPEDTLLFYFSGHGIPEGTGENYLAPSDIDPRTPYENGYSFEDLTKMMNRSVSTRIVAILDCCYSGSAKIAKGNEDSAARKGYQAINDTIAPGNGRCLLAACQGYEEAYSAKDASNSIFTRFLVEGLKGNKDSVDIDGNVTPDTLGKYVYNSLMSLSPEQRPRQKPIRKVEASGDIVLAQYPHLAKQGTDELLRLLQQEKVAEFNEIRAKNPYLPLNLSMANLHGEKLAGVNLERANLFGADLSKADLEEANLSKANLMEANLVGAKLHKANLGGADMQGAHLERADFSNVNLMQANLSKSYLAGTNLSGSDLSGATLLEITYDEATNLSETNLNEALFQDKLLPERSHGSAEAISKGSSVMSDSAIHSDFRGKNLPKVDLHGRELAGANFDGANLEDADLSDCNLQHAQFSRASLVRSNLHAADLSYAALSRANLEKADLSNAVLFGAELTEANLSKANLQEANLRKSNLAEVDLSGANLRNADLHEADLSGAKISTNELLLAKISTEELISVLKGKKRSLK